MDHDDACMQMIPRTMSVLLLRGKESRLTFTIHETGELERLLSCTTISLELRDTNLLALSLIY